MILTMGARARTGTNGLRPGAWAVIAINFFFCTNRQGGVEAQDSGGSIGPRFQQTKRSRQSGLLLFFLSFFDNSLDQI
jgi:hypothetical protein